MVVPPTDSVTIQIDPMWPHRSLWQHPFGDTLSVPFLDLEQGVQEQTNVEYTEETVIGRAEGYKSYIATGNREITLNFVFQAQGLGTTDGAAAAEAEVVMPVRFLDALKYPVHSVDQDRAYDPPPCLLRVGGLFTARVRLTAGDPDWRTPVDPTTLLPHVATFNATFTIVRRLGSELAYAFDGIWV